MPPASSLSRSVDPVEEVDRTTRSPQRIEDLRTVEASIEAAGWRIEYQQLGPGPAISDSIESYMDDVSLLFERHSLPMECAGETPKGAVTVVVPSRPDCVVLNGRFLGTDEIGVFGPGTELEGLTRDATSAWNIHIPVERFVSDREALGLEDGGFRADRAGALIVKGRIGPSALSTLLQGVGSSRTRLATTELAGELIREVVASIPGRRETGRHSRCTHRAIRAARDYIHSHLADPIRIPEVCAAAGVRQRTLERLFRSTLGMSPKRYVRTCRLNAVHRVLTDPSGCDASVTDVALRFGFAHLGRFASDYQSHFGRLPHAARKASLASR